MEDLSLTEAERTKLMELEQWYLIHKNQKNTNTSGTPTNTSIQHSGISSPQDKLETIQPPGTSEQATNEENQLLQNKMRITNIGIAQAPSGCITDQNKPQIVTVSHNSQARTSPTSTSDSSSSVAVTVKNKF